MSRPILLVIDDNKEFLGSIRRALRSEYDVQCACSPAEAMSMLSPPPDIALVDLRLSEDPENREGLPLLQFLRQHVPQTPTLMVTAYGDIETAVLCMRLGAVDFLQKSRVNIPEIKTRLAKALEYARLHRRVAELEEQLHLVRPHEIVGNSIRMRELKHLIEMVGRDGRVNVLIRGETGTGKELVARGIHESSWRKPGPFVPVTLTALPPQMIEAELFGYEPGAFTDARGRHLGYLEKAHGGVLFLDEIGEIDPTVQTKLLRFLEQREFQRLGSTTPVKVDVQLVAATNADLEALIKLRRFREDFYFRLKVHEIIVPPLRDRLEDLPLLVEHFLNLFRQQGKRIYRISPEALALLQNLPWPGNIRQLRNGIESSLFGAEMRKHEQIEVEDLPVDLRQQDHCPVPFTGQLPGERSFCIYEALAWAELFHIDKALQAVQGKKTEAWKLLGYNDRFTLYRRLQRIVAKHPNLVDNFSHVQATLVQLRRKTRH